jgi:hypothetical protein
MEELQSKTAKNMAGAQKDAAQADKTTAETALLPRTADADVTKTLSDAHKTMTETKLAPASLMLDAHSQDAEDQHRHEDRQVAQRRGQEGPRTGCRGCR